MTVAELIEILKILPQDARVAEVAESTFGDSEVRPYVVQTDYDGDAEL